jgi:cytochrome P450/NADPH-cytochrome P450 reductase
MIDMFDGMQDLASQMLLKWERFGPEAIIDPSDDFTRLALDTLAFCTMSYRLNSFYTDRKPKFGDAMTDFLKESGARGNRPTVVQALMSGTNAKYAEDIKYMTDIGNQIIAERRAHPNDTKDSLNAMLHGKDPKTGQGLADKNIMYNLLTFMIAGHETSSGTLSFITYYLIKNPNVMRKLRDEVDEVIGDAQIRVEHLSKLPYLTAIMRETLRLQPPASARSVSSAEDTTLSNGKYAIKANTSIVAQNWVAMRDPAVWGEDALAFRPERMLDGKFEALPPNAWQPFGFGMRGCIGRPFAWQEITLAIASIIQKFDLSFVDPSYALELKQALTIKPKGLEIRAALRQRTNKILAVPSSPLKAKISGGTPQAFQLPLPRTDASVPLYVLYGSNTGTSESFAQRIVTDSAKYGFYASLGTLDSATNHLPTDGPIIIVTASFEGEPADNATHFVDWLSHLETAELAGVRYGVFGCGNHDWVNTYQRIPTLCDDLLEKRGGQRLLPRGVGDAGASDFFQTFDEYEANMWEVLSKEFQTSRNESATSGFEVKTVDAGAARAAALRQPDAALGRVIENRLLTKPGAPPKRHIEFELPEGTTARAGDYLAIIPHNPPRDVDRVLAHFELPKEQEIIISSISPVSLPVDKAVNLSEVLSGYVELSQPATTRDLAALVKAATADESRKTLEGLIGAYAENVLNRRLSVLDILEAHRDIKLSLGAFLEMLPAMRVRQYSISSSPLWNAQHVTLTISVVGGPALSGREEEFLGVASNYLAHLRPGDRVQVAVRPSNAAFHPPADPLTPIVMFCAGSGFAPMRGFIQDRAAQKQSGREVSTALLFFGCRSPDEDFLYSDSDLAEWTKLGVVDVRPAFSRAPDLSEGCKYVQDRIWHDREEVSKAYRSDAKFFSCGSGKIAKGIQEVLVKIIKEKHEMDDEQAAAQFDKISTGRYSADIFD